MTKFSTRDIVTFIFAGGGTSVLCYLSAIGNREALIGLVATVSSVSSFYFGTKFGVEKKEPTGKEIK